MTHARAPSNMPCGQVQPLLDTFVDGELSPDLTLNVENHLNDCPHCNAFIDTAYAWKGNLRAAVYEDAEVTAELTERISLALKDQERRIEERQRMRRLGSHFGPLSWRAILPLVAAAACTLFWVRTRNVQSPASLPVASNNAARSVQASVSDALPLDEVLDKLIDYHSAPPAPQLTEPALVPQLERDVGVRVHLPSFDESQWSKSERERFIGVPQWRGATVVPVRGYRAAYLRYNIGGHSVTLYVYNSGRVPVHQKLEQRLVHDQPVYVGERRGYSIAARERKGIGYALATDLDAMESAELVASIH